MAAALFAARRRLLVSSSSKIAPLRTFASSRAVGKLIQLEIDGKQVEVEQGSSLIQVYAQLPHYYAPPWKQAQADHLFCLS